MNAKNPKAQKTIIGRELLNNLNAEGCPACGNKFTLGDPVVLASGSWGRHKKWIHENEAVYNKSTGAFIEQRCYRGSND